MGDKSSENYLDNLLNSINGNSSSGETYFDEVDDSASDDFLRQFEDELESEAYSEFLDDFDFDLDNNKKDSDKPKESIMHLPDDMEEELSLDAVLEQYESEEAEAGRRTEEAELTEEETFEEISNAVSEFDSSMGDIDMSMDDLDSSIGDIESPVEDLGEPDLAGNSDEDLMDLLDGDTEFADLGDILSEDGDLENPESEAAFEEFAEKEMDAQEKSIEDTINEALGMDGGDSEEGAKKGKKKSKDKEKKSGGFLDKLKKILFGDDEEEEAVTLGGLDGVNVSTLSDENAQILAELEGTANADEGKKDKKAKKEKKPKKEKPKKEKPPKEKKPPKPPKEKKPKVKDNTPPLPKAPVIMILIMVVSLTALVLLGTNLLNKGNNISSATRYYNMALAAIASEGAGADDVHLYTQAYEELAGMEFDKDDENSALYNKLTVLAAVSAKYDSYSTFHEFGSEEKALDALICAAGRCNLNSKTASEFECVNELASLQIVIEETLKDEYDMTYEDAVALYNMGNRNQYTVALHEKLQELGLE